MQQRARLTWQCGAKMQQQQQRSLHRRILLLLLLLRQCLQCRGSWCRVGLLEVAV
jgi:hypothetical protein